MNFLQPRRYWRPDMKNKILIVDDDIFSVMLIKAYLNHFGFGGELFTAFDAETAIAVAEKEKPGMIIMDVMLTSGMNGITAAEIIKGVHKDASIVFVTGCSDLETISRAVSTDPLAYLIKPVDINGLLSVYRGYFTIADEQEAIMVNTGRLPLLIEGLR